MTWQLNDIPDGQYADLIATARCGIGLIEHQVLIDRLMQSVAEEHCRGASPGSVVEFDDGPVTFLFALAGTSHADRTLLAVGRPERPHEVRDVAYQRGYPLPDLFAGRPVDRGHLIPYTGGGQYGPNLFVQDRALNRGWSRDGRGYRALERAAVAGAPDTLMFARTHYIDDTDVPGFIDLGVATASDVAVHRFRNRFDSTEARREMSIVLPGATNAQIGGLGEETAAVLLTENLDATLVAMGDARLPRDGTRQDLDLLAVVDGELIAYEVKTRYASTKAGRVTRAGNLLRPRLQRSRTPGTGQASQPYVADRLAGHIEVGDGYEGIVVQIIAVDFVAMLAQWFDVNDSGSGLRPAGPPIDCTDAALRALQQIVDHRGQL
ncbi:hypothetical protein [Williamsia sp. 1135]|uniref:hypothetical protein n=1 Tax=Williamsia sp. 1135 TaxID=1889262 RepID=UPI000A121883|nr:hypothetical protein [Williamsia sp. 1135]ORM38086.1 hypothetical protein BFL43_01445 [Williamsia sp. 1135]